MKIAVIGSGGREHAIAWKFAQSIPEEDIFVIPGNGGTKNNVDLNVNDFKAVEKFCKEKEIDLIFVGPEDPLANGIVDYFQDKDIKIFGPDKEAAQLEGSKIHAKRFMKKYGVATSDFWLAEDGDDIEQIIRKNDGNIVIKYDGLAAGKGVFVCSSVQEAMEALSEIKKRYGNDAHYIVEQKISGQELSIIGFTDGKDIKLLMTSQDHKPAYDGDKGPNTGGMGAYCPVPLATESVLTDIKTKIVEPTLRGLEAEELNYKGVIYFGIMMTESGPMLLEYNVRFGDPETEVILPSLKSDLLELVLSCLNGTLSSFKMEFNEGYFVDVVLASGGYPGSYEKGKVITGLDKILDDAMAFHAGTKKENGNILTSGGRVLNIIGKGSDLKSAIEKAYAEVEQVTFDGMFYRKDIGKKGIRS
jgi:phosphoribosylamine---glycine ligase